MPLAGRRVLVAGAGVTGESVAGALVEAGALVTVTDERAEQLDRLAATVAVTCVPGLTSPPEGTDLVVTSPGWRQNTPVLRAAADAGIEVIGDVELAWQLGQARQRPPVWLAVTGTNGKSTTVSMLAEILVAAGRHAVACGNVGFAVTDAVRSGYEVLAVELSSFQLHWSRGLAPYAAVVLNVAEDHLDWHGSMSAYAEAKGSIYDRTRLAVYNAQDRYSGTLAHRRAPGDARRVGIVPGPPAQGELGVDSGMLVDRAFGEDTQPVSLCPTSEIRPAGPHNVVNALAAAALARGYGVSAEAVREGLLAFRPEDHRATLVAEVGGVRYVNDSKATNPHAAGGSLAAYDHVVWIAGGQLKGASPETVDALVAEHAGRLRGVVVIGADAGVIADAVARHAPDIPLIHPDPGDDGVMAAAVGAASAMARSGDVVLLAPAAASLDMFRSYAHRGDAFAAAVRSLRG
ncbi:UDP-N-acetylmuramoyl-L-alanine--D-glutamate ligase [Haloechinothrix sp. LS1_15]|uniref:UDP-N-acetylmuramoyl-L-alanine--D-glutamate ligase n=1 Tax=Haloechinothrix sp. LS1_15 TaxID=2652248 RepID=UPI002944AAFB|nr:UDP-N-acetylmuramoyl-L-alanine--D-glutamate ligase [Haloechinothrix sp. LS1_15]MDV6013475.1 UDP-N-acetylmuramoyl-L-alanine--D-glutamate ligase [Haloechinothrix sp. LS1_15]